VVRAPAYIAGGLWFNPMPDHLCFPRSSQRFLTGNGGPHAIFLPRQKRHARGGFFSGMFLEGKELSPTEGDFADLRRNSVTGRVVWRGETCDVSDGIGCDWLSVGEPGRLRSGN
jgi:hypothetical protein